MPERGTTIFEYLKEPHPWFDTTHYTPAQIGMFFAGAVMWVIVYINTIYRARKYRRLDIPIIAVCLNWGCEISTAIFFVPDMGNALVLAYWAWMVLDGFIVWELFKYGRHQVRVEYFKKNFFRIMAICFVFSFFIQRYFIVQYDLPMAPLDSYIINLVMSVCFLYLVFLPGYENDSIITSWGKMLGTGIISIMFFTKYPDNNFLTSLYIACFVFDLWYLILLYQIKKKRI